MWAHCCGDVMKGSATKELLHARGPHGATHPPWGFRREAAMWNADVPIGPNMLPLAAEMCEWLAQKRVGLSVCVDEHRGKVGYATNPYSYHASTIGTSLGAIIRAAFTFSEASDELDALEAEITRVRLYNELILYSARFCEATIKQMLYCTQIPRRLYKRASLGQLLAVDCEACRKSGDEKHDISLLGALAHQYFLCHTLEHCMADHLTLVGRRRNVEAAHAESQTLDPRGAPLSREHLKRSLNEVGHEFAHMMDHIGQIELRMLSEISLINSSYPNIPDLRDFSLVPARPRMALHQ